MTGEIDQSLSSGAPQLEDRHMAETEKVGRVPASAKSAGTRGVEDVLQRGVNAS